MSGRDPFNSLPSCFCRDYEIVLNQNLVEDVQGLSSPHALKIAGPQNFFIDLVRPHVELSHDSGICLWGFGHWRYVATKSPYFNCYAILPS